MSLLQKLEEGKGLLVGGHRGHLSDIRENTIPNFEKACALGISHLEIDVQLTKDDQIAVYHDLELSQKSPLRGAIRDYTLDQLREAFEINSLEEVLAWAKPLGHTIAIEIKTENLTMGPQVARLGELLPDLLDTYSFQENSFVFSVDYRTLRQIKQKDPRINIGLIVPHIPADPIALMREMEAIIYLCYIESMDKGIVRDLHNHGFYADGSVINDARRLEQALELGVDMIESDNPGEILALLGKGGLSLDR